MDIQKIIKTVLCATLIFAIACGGGGTTGTGVINTGKVKVEGNVSNEQGEPVPNAQIQVSGENTTYQTDAQGNFSFESENASQDFILEIRKGEISSQLTIDADLNQDNIITLSIKLKDRNGFNLQKPRTDNSSLSCDQDADCSSNQYCDFSDLSCGSSGSQGVCKDFSTNSICSLHYEPVCGCDGNTYSNSCEAARAGTSLSATQECFPIQPTLPPGEIIIDPIEDINTCSSNSDCSSGEYCAFLDNACGALILGTCSPAPTISNCPSVYEPVCGCNGVTYTNSCEAIKAGQSTAKQGTC